MPQLPPLPQAPALSELVVLVPSKQGRASPVAGVVTLTCVTFFPLTFFINELLQSTASEPEERLGTKDAECGNRPVPSIRSAPTRPGQPPQDPFYFRCLLWPFHQDWGLGPYKVSYSNIKEIWSPVVPRGYLEYVSAMSIDLYIQERENQEPRVDAMS